MSCKEALDDTFFEIIVSLCSSNKFVQDLTRYLAENAQNYLDAPDQSEKQNQIYSRYREIYSNSILTALASYKIPKEQIVPAVNYIIFTEQFHLEPFGVNAFFAYQSTNIFTFLLQSTYWEKQFESLKGHHSDQEAQAQEKLTESRSHLQTAVDHALQHLIDEEESIHGKKNAGSSSSPQSSASAQTATASVLPKPSYSSESSSSSVSPATPYSNPSSPSDTSDSASRPVSLVDRPPVYREKAVTATQSLEAGSSHIEPSTSGLADADVNDSTLQKQPTYSHPSGMTSQPPVQPAYAEPSSFSSHQLSESSLSNEPLVDTTPQESEGSL